MDMMDCACDVLKEFPIKFKGDSRSLTPAGVDVFDTNLSQKLNEDVKTTFH